VSFKLWGWIWGTFAWQRLIQHNQTHKHMTRDIQTLNSTTLICLGDHLLSLNIEMLAFTFFHRLISKVQIGAESGAQNSAHLPWTLPVMDLTFGQEYTV
jgi:hypothetical protein